MRNIRAHEPSIADPCEIVTEEQSIHIGSRLHLLDLLIELIQFNSFSDLQIDQYAKSLIYPDTETSEWPFGTFPEAPAVQEMYIQRTGMYAFHTFMTSNRTWTK